MAATVLHGISSSDSNSTNYYYQSLRRVGEREPEWLHKTFDGGKAPSQSVGGGHDGVSFSSHHPSKIFIFTKKFFIFIFSLIEVF